MEDENFNVLMSRLRKAGIKVRFVTNESVRTRSSLHNKLTRLGFDMELEDILTPAMAMMHVIKENGAQVHVMKVF